MKTADTKRRAAAMSTKACLAEEAPVAVAVAAAAMAVLAVPRVDHPADRETRAVGEDAESISAIQDAAQDDSFVSLCQVTVGLSSTT